MTLVIRMANKELQDLSMSILAGLDSGKGAAKQKKRKPRTIHYRRNADGKRLFKERKNYAPKSVKKACLDKDLNHTENDEDWLTEIEECSDDQPSLASYEEEVNQCFNTLKSLLPTHVKQPRRRQSWNKRMFSSFEAWNKKRADIHEEYYMLQVLDSLCNNCLSHRSCVTCSQCHKDYCAKCDRETHHLHPFHDRCFIDKYQVPLSPLQVIDDENHIQKAVRILPLKRYSCLSCTSTDIIYDPCDDMCIVLNERGRYDFYKYTIVCKSCGAKDDPFDLRTIIRSGYWPAAPTTLNYLVDVNLFNLWSNIRSKMPGTSESSFIAALVELSLGNGRIGTIHRIAFSTSFREWCYCLYEKEKIQENMWFDCPCCTISQHSCHVDGNCKLYRFKSAGKSRKQAYYGDLFFSKNDDVSGFNTAIYGKCRNKDEIDDVCGGRWTAARNLIKKGRSKDETGLELISCRHAIGQMALNMFQGELFGYPLFLIKRLVEKNAPKYCFADVMCKLWGFIKRKEPGLALKTKPALSVMHAKGHSLNCQVQWDGAWTDGTGKSTGEETEQIFSFLSRCGNSTKHQLPENREEHITEMMASWNKNKIRGLAKDLVRRYRKNTTNIKESRSDMKKFIESLTPQPSESQLQIWVKEIKMTALGVKRKQSKAVISSMEKFVYYLKDCCDIFPEFSKSIIEKLLFPVHTDVGLGETIAISKRVGFVKSHLDNEDINESDILMHYNNVKDRIILPQLQNHIESKFFEKTRWKAAIKKLADTSKRRHIMRVKLATTVKSLKETIVDYCLVSKCDNDVKERIESGSFPWLLTVSSFPTKGIDL